MSMEIGALYRVQFKSQSANYHWSVREMTAVYLGRSKDGESILFSLRPVAGTTELSTRFNPLVEVEQIMSKDQVMSLPHGIRDRALPVKPSRRIGPVEGPVGIE